ncbi:MAG: RNB domain-containing ribonuclease, partial [Planctomycetota bacterium]
LPGKVFPMLPERLSNNLCSLRPEEDRLAKVVWMQVSSEGELQSYSVENAVMRSARRFTYEEVLKVLEGEKLGRGEKALTEALHTMDRLRKVLHRRRVQGGALDLDIAEPRVFLDKSGEVTEIREQRRDAAHHLIEEFMLLANEAVARLATERTLAIIRRVHPSPPEGDLEGFLRFCRVLAPGVQVSGPEDFQALVEAVRGQPAALILNLALLRTMSRAEYSAAKGLHFALATDEYCHFTSPIRRYPDLQVHRALDTVLGRSQGRTAGRKKGHQLAPEDSPSLEQMAQHCSFKERRAEGAEREMTKLRVIYWLRERLGDRFTGIITAVFDYGFFVRLDGILVEGMTPISELRDDYYLLHEAQFALRGRHKGKIFRLGDPVEVELRRADPLSRQIDLRYLHHRSPKK